MDNELEPGGSDWGRRELLWSMHGDVGWGSWLVIVILLLLLAALVIAVVIALLRSLPGLGTAAAGPARQTEAELLLDERYARGEIDEIEYLHRRAVLRGG